MVEEGAQEDLEQILCDMAKNDLQVEISPIDIVAAHRLPRGSSDGPRPVIVKCLKRSKKEAVIKNRKNLKGKRMAIVDDLCREYQQMMNRAQKDERVKNCWYWNGKMFIENQDGQKGPFYYQQSMEEALQRIRLAPARSH